MTRRCTIRPRSRGRTRPHGPRPSIRSRRGRPMRLCAPLASIPAERRRSSRRPGHAYRSLARPGSSRADSSTSNNAARTRQAATAPSHRRSNGDRLRSRSPVPRTSASPVAVRAANRSPPRRRRPPTLGRVRSRRSGSFSRVHECRRINDQSLAPIIIAGSWLLPRRSPGDRSPDRRPAKRRETCRSRGSTRCSGGSTLAQIDPMGPGERESTICE